MDSINKNVRFNVLDAIYPFFHASIYAILRDFKNQNLYLCIRSGRYLHF